MTLLDRVTKYDAILMTLARNPQWPAETQATLRGTAERTLPIDLVDQHVAAVERDTLRCAARAWEFGAGAGREE